MGSSGFVHVKNQKRKTRRTPKNRPYLLRSNMFFVTVRKTQWFNDPINLSEFAASGCPHMLSTFGQDFGSPGLFQYTQPLLVSWNILMHWSFAGNASWPCPRSHDSCQTLSRDLWATKCRKCCSMSVAGQGVRIPQVSIYNRRHAGTPSWTYLHRKIGQILGCSKFENSQDQPEWSTVLQPAGKSMVWIFMICAFEHQKTLEFWSILPESPSAPEPCQPCAKRPKRTLSPSHRGFQ